jgi:hypothetical protein
MEKARRYTIMGKDRDKKDQNLSRFISQFLCPFSMECEGKGNAG